MGCAPSKSSVQGNSYPGMGPGQGQPVNQLPLPPRPNQPQPSTQPTHSNPQIAPAPSDSSGMSFITRQGHTLYENGRPFRFISINVPNLFFIEDRPDACGWVLPDPYEQHDALLTVAHMGGRVARTYTLGAGCNFHVTQPRKYNEDCFVAMDHALAIARNVGVRLIVPLVNNYGGKDEVGACGDALFGNYAAFAGLRGKKPSAFWTDPELVEDFKHLISFVLNRVNTVNGIRYGDDPIVLAWQLGNELGGWNGPNPPTSWTLGMTAHIRSLAPNTLVLDGTMGGLKAKDKYDRQALSSPAGPDIFTNHYYYGESDIKRLKDDSSFVAKHSKAFIVGEFGFSNTGVYGRMYEDILRNDKVTGSLIWSLRFHSMFGGFYVHSEEGGKYWSYHAPGFPSRNRGFCFEEAEVIPQIRNYALRIQGLDPRTVPYPVPQAPYLLEDIRPKCFRFRGSAWAARYVIYRGRARDEFGGVEWEPNPVATNVTDDVCSGSTLWRDEGAMEGVPYYYAVQAVGVGGDCSPWSNVVGPTYV
ncbi:uncharacterized protein SPPG_06393 [Spizellomyces punctatus DAOM BR117]|uniref:mannan endo-1,4-beta-mannosidase n=1 Tax=Spizellomyces punctatus (strain DAOM BR117) TaxID=645134 RepID=A0A0L0HAW0_SPIPD|nr:uncharacterized protein SPPG_06393 [Spizellomyces punctatus DAOM BR117]KNC98715.1 hypothetical protein SPPG_06393 [Spizellomyces punctatus DAOM BR117]|eukprot:XP_016606755.1 hypothetical protein SPPG_06393 [Spizellomyces punctatus DAOM BR117]